MRIFKVKKYDFIFIFLLLVLVFCLFVWLVGVFCLFGFGFCCCCFKMLFIVVLFGIIGKNEPFLIFSFIIHYPAGKPKGIFGERQKSS